MFQGKPEAAADPREVRVGFCMRAIAIFLIFFSVAKFVSQSSSHNRNLGVSGLKLRMMTFRLSSTGPLSRPMKHCSQHWPLPSRGSPSCVRNPRQLVMSSSLHFSEL